MCGRFVQSADIDDYLDYFTAEHAGAEELPPSWNVAPTDRVYALAVHEGKRLLGTFRWGLLPHWAKHKGAGHINARAETLLEKEVFRTAALRRRCLIPAEGFYEWERRNGSKQPHLIRLNGEPMALAGIWSRWHDPEIGGRISTCAIVTTSPNPVVARLHDRMPVPLAPEIWDEWLDPEQQDPPAVMDLIRPVEPARWTDHPVSQLVNSVRNNGPELVIPLADPT